jgi:signal-transduction protein with cAMP-binding, CBS, and nucleotidyltransferase domain
MERKVRDVMTPQPIGVFYEQSIAEAAIAMRDAGVGVVLVVREHSLIGVVTDRDLVIRGVAAGMEPTDPVGPLCSRGLVTVDADTSTEEAVSLVRQKAVRRLPVVADGEVVGIVSLGDLAMALDEKSALAQVSEAAPNG